MPARCRRQLPKGVYCPVAQRYKRESLSTTVLQQFALFTLSPLNLSYFLFTHDNMKFTTVISTLAIGALAQLVGAAPMAKVARDVWDPKVTYPTATTIWESGQTYTVTWYAVAVGSTTNRCLDVVHSGIPLTSLRRSRTLSPISALRSITSSLQVRTYLVRLVPAAYVLQSFWLMASIFATARFR